MHKRSLWAALVAAAMVVCPALATLTSTVNTVTYTGNGATTAYTVPFKFLQSADLVVTVAGATKVLNSDYTVKGAGNATGTVTFITAPATSAAVVITRTVDYTQKTSLAQNRTPDPRTVESALDKLAMGEQQLQGLFTNPPATVLPSNVTARLNGIRFADQFANIQAAITDAGTTGAVLIPPTYTATDSYTNPNNIAILDLRGGSKALRGVIYASDYGAKCDNATDDTAALQAALNAIGPSGTARTLIIPPGNCIVSSTLNMSGFVGVTVRGLGYVSVLKWKGGSAGPMFFLSGTRESTLTDIKLQPFTASFPIASVIVQEQPSLGSGLTSTMNTFRRVQIAGLGVVTQGIYIKGDVTDANNDFNNFEQVFINGYTEAALLIQGANSFSNRILNCQFGGGLVAHYGVKAINGAGGESGHFSISGGATLGHTTADIYIQSNSSFPYVIDNLYSETSTAFLIEDGAIGTRNSTVIRGVKFASSNVGASPMITIKNPGPVLIENSFLGTDFTKAPTVLWTYAAGFSPPSFRVVNSRFRGTLTSLAAIFNAQPTVVWDSYWETSTTVYGLLDRATFDGFGRFTQSGLIFAQLGTPANGTLVFCLDCTIANPCAGGGTGAFAKRLNNVWVCN